MPSLRTRIAYQATLTDSIEASVIVVQAAAASAQASANTAQTEVNTLEVEMSPARLSYLAIP